MDRQHLERGENAAIDAAVGDRRTLAGRQRHLRVLQAPAGSTSSGLISSTAPTLPACRLGSVEWAWSCRGAQFEGLELRPGVEERPRVDRCLGDACGPAARRRGGRRELAVRRRRPSRYRAGQHVRADAQRLQHQLVGAQAEGAGEVAREHAMAGVRERLGAQRADEHRQRRRQRRRAGPRAEVDGSRPGAPRTPGSPRPGHARGETACATGRNATTARLRSLALSDAVPGPGRPVRQPATAARHSAAAASGPGTRPTPSRGCRR